MTAWQCIVLFFGAGLPVLLVLAVSRIKDPYAKDYKATVEDVLSRQWILSYLAGKTDDFPDKLNRFESIKPSPLAFKDNSLHLSSVDMFVQVAQQTLIRRKNIMYFLCFTCIITFCFTVFYIESITHSTNFLKRVVFNGEWLKENMPYVSALTWPSAFYLIARNGSAIAIYLFFLYIIVSLFRAFVHEATILENRIHAIRLGRLYFYMKFVGLEDKFSVKDAAGKISAEDLEKVFGWNIETSTAFKDINPELVSRSVFGQIAAAIAGLTSKK